MSGHGLFERILGSLHGAVLDDTLWPAAAGLIDEACGAKGNCLATGDGVSNDDVDVFFTRFCFRGERREDFERLYLERYHGCDERIPRLRELPDSHVVHVSSLYTEEEKRTSLVYNEVLALSHTRENSLNVRLNGPGGSRIVWVVADPVDDRGWSSKRVETIERLLPHLRQYVRVRQSLVDARALGSSLTALLENTKCGIIHLGRRRRMVAVNDRARDLLAKGDGLVDEDGFLHTASRRDEAALQKLLARAMPSVAGESASGSMTVRRVHDVPLVVHASPVSPARADEDGSRIGAVVLLVDPARRSVAAPEVVAEALGLTPAESCIAVSLAGGMTVREIALATGRSEGTVRWHVQHILRKHDFSRQHELVQLVRSLGDVP